MAERAEHTLGPWRYGPNLAYPAGVYWIEGSDGEDITDTVLGEENARLIAAAPGLLAALKNFLEASADEWLYQTGQFSRRESPPANYPPQGSVHIGLMGAGEQARAAIEAAEA